MYRLVIVTVMATGVLAFADNAVGAEIGKQELLELLRASESSIRNAQSVLKRTYFDVSKDGEIGAATGRWDEVAGHLGAASQTRYVLEIEREIFSGSAGGSQNQHQFRSYDGAVSMGFDYGSSPGSTIRRPNRGYVDSVPDNDVQFMTTRWAGLSLIPSFYQATGLANYLDTLSGSDADWRILEYDEKGIVRIWHPLNEKFAASDDLVSPREAWPSYVLEIDTSKDCVIVGFEVHIGVSGKYDEPSHKSKFYEILDVELVEFEGQWLPASYTLKGGGWDPKKQREVYFSLDRYTFEWKGLNQDQAEIEYRLKFPMGTHVIDRVVDLKYVVGVSDMDYDSVFGFANYIVKKAARIDPLTVPDPSVHRGSTDPDAMSVLKTGAMTVVVGVVAILMVAVWIRRRSKARGCLPGDS